MAADYKRPSHDHLMAAVKVLNAAADVERKVGNTDAAQLLRGHSISVLAIANSTKLADETVW